MAAGRAFPWHELYVPDDAAGADFYTKALGMGTQDMSMGEMGTYKMLTHNGNAVCGIMSTSSPQMKEMNIPPHWAVYMNVDDVDERIAKVKEHGGTVVVPAMDIPTVGRMALIHDPQGAHIWLFKPAPM
jgi:predicted enzyme related to lactoylglutathione lyase